MERMWTVWLPCACEKGLKGRLSDNPVARGRGREALERDNAVFFWVEWGEGVCGGSCGGGVRGAESTIYDLGFTIWAGGGGEWSRSETPLPFSGLEKRQRSVSG